jgi:hypothetical protein
VSDKIRDRDRDQELKHKDAKLRKIIFELARLKV